MQIAIFGLGYVGLTGGACALQSGHRVHGVDVIQGKVDEVNAGMSPIMEPKVPELLAQGHADGRLSASASVGPEIADWDIAMVCVGTPSLPDGSHNMSYIADVTRQIGNALAKVDRNGEPLAIVFRSTVRPGTMANLVWPILREEIGDNAEEKAAVVYNPEFLRESTAVDDYFSPPKIVMGTADGTPNAKLTELFEGIDAPRFHCQYNDSELVKFVDNAWHAVKVGFANEIGRVAKGLDVSSRVVHEIFVSDTKLNISPYYLRPGGAFGGSCLPKDVRALAYLGKVADEDLPVVQALLPSNAAHKDFIFRTAVAGLEPGAKILMLGLTFKNDTDDLRESPNVDLAESLLKAKYDLAIYDPAIVAMNLRGQNLGFILNRLPQLRELLADDSVFADGASAFDRVIDMNGAAKSLGPFQAEVVDLNRLP